MKKVIKEIISTSLYVLLVLCLSYLLPLWDSAQKYRGHPWRQP